MKLFSHKKRAVHLGPYPLERLPRHDDPLSEVELRGACSPVEADHEGKLSVGHSLGLYVDLFDARVDGDVFESAPIPDSLTARSHHLKSGLYFLDADMVGVGAIPESAWLPGPHSDHPFSVVTLIAFTRKLSGAQPGDTWIDGTRQAAANLRATELGVITADYIRRLGFEAKAHTPTTSDLNLDAVALQCGLVEVDGSTLRAPFLDGGFALSIVSTTMPLEPDRPLKNRTMADRLRSTSSFGWAFGRGGTRAGVGRLNGDHRALHMGRYPMEKIKRADESTTLIIDDEVPRVPVRAGGFPRAANGDMGPKFKADVKVFAFKTPQAQGYVQQIAEMVPYQDGEVAAERHQSTSDAQTNTDALKALAYHLGGDMVGVCEVPNYAWYSHRVTVT